MRQHRPGYSILLAAAILLSACGSGSSKTTAPTTTSPGVTTTTGAPSTTAPATTTTTIAAADAGAWSLVPNGPNPLARPFAWTGKEVLAAESACCGAVGSVNLSAYNPVTGSWRKLPDAPLTHRTLAAGVWTGSEMIVAGGFASPTSSAEHLAPATDGAAWNAATGTWHAIAAMPAPLASAVPVPGPTAVWTGREMLVWSSVPEAMSPPVAREVVMAYNPATDKWRTLPASGLAPRIYPVTVWTGKELVVWGGLHGNYKGPFADGARLDPNTNTWSPLPAAPVPARGEAAAVWSGHEVLLWGGNDGTSSVGQGAAYNPATNAWRALPASPLRAKTLPAGVWNGHYFYVIGGAAGYKLPVPGPGTAAYDPATNKWTALPAAPGYPPAYQHGPTFAADQRQDGLGVWTGKSVVVVGGLDFVRQEPLADGVQWTPSTGG